MRRNCACGGIHGVLYAHVMINAVDVGTVFVDKQALPKQQGYCSSLVLLVLQEQFWRENVGHFEEKDFQILRVLVKLLEAGREPRTLAVACHDLGQFITYYPGGKGVVTGEARQLLSMLMLGFTASVRHHLSPRQ